MQYYSSTSCLHPPFSLHIFYFRQFSGGRPTYRFLCGPAPRLLRNMAHAPNRPRIYYTRTTAYDSRGGRRTLSTTRCLHCAHCPVAVRLPTCPTNRTCLYLPISVEPTHQPSRWTPSPHYLLPATPKTCSICRPTFPSACLRTTTTSPWHAHFCHSTIPDLFGAVPTWLSPLSDERQLLPRMVVFVYTPRHHFMDAGPLTLQRTCASDRHSSNMAARRRTSTFTPPYYLETQPTACHAPRLHRSARAHARARTASRTHAHFTLQLLAARTRACCGRLVCRTGWRAGRQQLRTPLMDGRLNHAFYLRNRVLDARRARSAYQRQASTTPSKQPLQLQHIRAIALRARRAR